ncbi:MAG: hypothetical protein AAF938_18565 [Myxococcota bacterium]
MVRALTALLLLVACRGDAAFGASCTDTRDCSEGLCAAGVAGEGGVCTRSCASDQECPEGWSCSGATENMVLVCVRGAATPFGY